MSRRLLTFGRAIFASPGYIAEMGLPVEPEDLRGHRVAGHTIVDARDVPWTCRGKPTPRPPLPAPRWMMNDSAALERFALSGGGLALLSTFEAAKLVQRGDLVRVLPDYEQDGANASLVWPASRHLAPRVRAFIDHAVAEMGRGQD